MALPTSVEAPDSQAAAPGEDRPIRLGGLEVMTLYEKVTTYG